MLVDLRAREGGLRAALRAQQPARLGRHPGGGHRPAARIERRIMSADPHAFRGAHPTEGGVVIRTVRPAAQDGHRLREEQGGRGARAGRHRRAVRGRGAEGEAAARLPARGRLRRGRDVPDRGPLPLPADARRARPAPRGRGPPRGDLRPPRRARDRARGRARAPSFAVWAPAAQSVSVVGDLNCWDGRLHPMRALGSSGIWELFLPEVGAGTNYKYEITGPDGDRFQKADPYAFQAELPPKTASVVHEPAARVARREVAGAAAQEHAARRADVGLRGPPRLVAAEPARGQPLADLPRAGRRARRLREGHGLHPPRAAAGHAPPVHAARGATR